MDDYTFDTGSGEAVLSCVVWGDVPPFSVEWSDEDDATVANVANKVSLHFYLTLIYPHHNHDVLPQINMNNEASNERALLGALLGACYRNWCCDWCRPL